MKAHPLNLAPNAVFDSLQPRRKVLLLGNGANSLATYVTARNACEGRMVRIVCGDNRFDPYAIARFAKSRHIRPRDALNSIYIARAFTAFQMTELILGLDTESQFVIVTGVCSAFFDDDLTHTDAARLFYRSLWHLVELARTGVSFLFVENQPAASPRRQYFVNDLYQSSEVIVKLSGAATFALDQRLSKAEARLRVLNEPNR